MKKVFIPDHKNVSGANIWIYEGYKRAWEYLGYTVEYYSPNCLTKIEATINSGSYYVMATDWFYEPLHNSKFLAGAEKVLLFPQPTNFPEPWGLHSNFISSLTPKTINEINEQKNIKLWSFGEVGKTKNEYFPLWKDIETVPLAFDNISYEYLEDSKFKFDVCFVGGRANNGFDEKYKIMMTHFSAFKDSGLKCGIFVGRNLTHEQENKLLYNSKVAINIHDAYQRALRLDTNERTFKALGLTGVLVSDDEGQLEKLFPEVERTNDPNQMIEYVKEYVNMPAEELNSIKEKNRKMILENHTYAHRVKQLLEL
jgi:hypothetical protein